MILGFVLKPNPGYALAPFELANVCLLLEIVIF